MTSAKRMSCSGRLTACTAIPVRASNVQGMPKPTAATSPPTAVRTLLDGVRDHLHELASGRGRAQGGWYGDGPSRSASTAPASSLVPPRSTPMTHPSATPATLPPAPPHGRRRRPPLHHLQGPPALPRRAATTTASTRATATAPSTRSTAAAGASTRALARAAAAAPAAAGSPSAAILALRRLRRGRLGADLARSLFLISAQIQEAKISDAAERAARPAAATRSPRPTPC